MPRAVLKDGIIYPLEPLPPDWIDGKEPWVDIANNGVGLVKKDLSDVDAVFDELEKLCSAGDSKDDEIMQAAIDEHRQNAKRMMRRQMGLPE